MNQESAKRSIAKTISWRIIATVLMFITVWILTGALYVSLVSSIIAGALNTIVYYFHERFWNRLSWGKQR